MTKARPCKVCERDDWCGFSDDGSVAVCMRTESEKPTRNGGWLHRLREGSDFRPRHTARVAVFKRPACDFGKLTQECEQAVSDRRMEQLAHELGVSTLSLRRLHIGWDGHAWTFPMRDATGRILGIRRRFPDGRKLSVKGGREGLFVPNGLADTGLLAICEGPTDCAAILTLGIEAIGRPNCTGGTPHIVNLVRRRCVVIVGDRDGPGQRGALRLAATLRPLCCTVTVIVPPLGIKDAREWVRSGASRSDLLRTIESNPAERRYRTPNTHGVQYRVSRTVQ
ncbi:MAG: toprim domain-containing protein [Planctomycetes bacterium]|nr:toprim domain-containing protein [Planctomycetota bacterium]